MEVVPDQEVMHPDLGGRRGCFYTSMFSSRLARLSSRRLQLFGVGLISLFHSKIWRYLGGISSPLIGSSRPSRHPRAAIYLLLRLHLIYAPHAIPHYVHPVFDG